MADLTTLDDLFVRKLRYVYDAEQRLTKALPKLAESARSSVLKQAIETHQMETQTHVARLEQLFGILGTKSNADTDDAIKGLISAAGDMAGLHGDDAVRDAAIISAAQEAEHYEIAAYGTLRTWARLLGHGEGAQLLERTLEEEKKADQKLTEIAGALNLQAATSHAR